MSQLNEVPTKYIKKFSDVFTPDISNDYNTCVAIVINSTNIDVNISSCADDTTPFITGMMMMMNTFIL